ncbi:MAG: DUF4954 family protein [Spirochaetaceae bacterium]|jgi:NDP-sugar pyrophosphorylase family protein|nr:DUF4954 family protein [Spirochaetaceae bacterium]
MNTLFIRGTAGLGYGFIDETCLPPGKDEWYLRTAQANKMLGREETSYRRLTESEIKLLEENGNESPAWNDVYVSDIFDAALIQNTFFSGMVRIGNLEAGCLKFHDYIQRTGIRNSRIISCDIGDNCAINDCAYISHYIIGNGVILSCINEMDTTNHSKFGEGIVKDGEDEDVRVYIEPVNEAGGRRIIPFNGMTCADAYLWAMYRADAKLINTFKTITQKNSDSRRGYYGTVGHGAVIKHCATIKDTRIGDAAYIKGANKLKNLTINSDEAEPAQIGEGVELVNGIVGYGCHVFYGCKAVRFVLGNNCKLNYGARLINSVLGDNSTISCCEVLNNLVFPAHEQHHNNSFLIAALVLGQSNMAAGATIGSNHNSRGNDGEIVAGRGFWPGLSCSMKHNSRFASYCLITKGVYPFELNITLPFSMLTTSGDGKRREVMPAYMWMYNMYALFRNARKYKDRDKRKKAIQVYETDFLAPDTVQEIIAALSLFKEWSAINQGSKQFFAAPRTLERSHIGVRIIKPEEAVAAYRQMLLYYAVKTLLTLPEDYMYQETKQRADAGSVGGSGGGSVYGRLCALAKAAGNVSETSAWENLGGQLVPVYKAEALRDKIRDGSLACWQDIHNEYARLHAEYPLDKAHNAIYVLRFLQGGSFPAPEAWNVLLDETHIICEYIKKQVYITKRKDYTDHFRNITFQSKAEQDAVIGRLDANVCIMQTRAEISALKKLIDGAYEPSN